MAIFRFIGVLVLLIALSCSRGYQSASYLEEPESDITPPHLELFIKYYKNGRHRSMTLNEKDAAIKTTVDKNYPLIIQYSGQDEEGLKSIYLSVTEKKILLGKEQKREYNIMPLTASRPKAKIEDSFTLQKEAGTRTVNIQLKGVNWLNMPSATEVHTFILE